MSKKTDPCDLYWAKLFGQAQVILSGASNAQMKVQLFDTLDEFFDKSNCWQETITFMVVNTTCDYPLTVREGRIQRLNGVYDQYNTPQQALMPEIGTVRFLFPYSNTQPMTAVVVKTVTDPLSCFPPNIPDWLLPLHGLVIFHGIVGAMMQMPGQSYSNPDMGMFHQKKFLDGMAKARAASQAMNTVGAQSWHFPQSFQTRSQKGGLNTFNTYPTPR